MPDTNFAELLDSNVDDAEKPSPLPVGNYIVIWDSTELTNLGKKETPACQAQFALQSACDDVNPKDLEDVLKGKTLQERPNIRHTFWLTDDAKWRLADAMKKSGANTSGRSFAAVLPELKGLPVKVYIKQRPVGDVIYNDIDSFAPAE